ncbi:tetratricopeptide repeat protein [Cohnella sp. JJ-181]|uniref:tetratricopeptide repeat protein n=1 Tax=Cohnella rhizoplanae TaxID=2974897 RepID=UPI0022FF71F4|nr:hypothetical protein [Cohnella sp. JJ-181]CAI6083268.1 hypothetical protein COHCIP112018_03932 [Cohnella sp. JJ-181]
MKKMSAPRFFALLLTIGMVFVLVSGICMAQGGSADDEQAYRDQANRLVAVKNYDEAASVLEELLAKNPNLDDELVYKQLTHIYDDYLFHFDKALTYYHTYLDLFPDGKFARGFIDRIAYLEERRPEWQALRAFRSVQLEEDRVPLKERLAEVEAILSKQEHAKLAPELHLYLANQYYEAADYRAAGEHAEKYISSISGAGVTNTDRASALRLYADILVKQHHYSKAIRALDQATALASPEDSFNDDLKKSEMIKHRNMWYGLIFCLIYYLSVVILLFPTRFWKSFNLRRSSNRLAKPILLLGVVSLGPVLILNIVQGPILDPRFFFWLSGFSILSTIVIKLLAPLSRKTGRLVFITMSGLHMAAAWFMAYYMTIYSGRKVITNTVIEADIDPLTSTFLILVWGSAIASLSIVMISSFVYSRAKGND